MNEEYKLSVTGKVLDFSEALKKPCPSKITVMVLAASNKIVINENHSKNGVKGMQITISAPVWEIISDRIVNFDGTTNSEFTFFEGFKTIIDRTITNSKKVESLSLIQKVNEEPKTNGEQKTTKKPDSLGAMRKKFQMYARL